MERLKGLAFFAIAALAAAAAVKLFRVPPPAAAPEVPPSAQVEPAPEPEPAAPPAVSTPAAPAPPPPARPAARPRPPQDAALRRVYGVVYDLVTGRAVPGARVVFKAVGGGLAREAKTDAEGYYELDVRDSPDLTAWVEADGYKAGMLEERDPPLRLAPRAEREQLARTVLRDPFEPLPIRYLPSELVLSADFVLVPLVPTAADNR